MRMMLLLTTGVCSVAYASFGAAQAAEKIDARPVGLCILVSKADLRVRKAEVIVSSGDLARDNKAKSEVIGMRTPTPVAWTRDFWASVWIGGDPGAAQSIGCAHLNKQLCNAVDCRVAP